ncbi:PH domain-containing protein [Desulfonatronum thiosulfatophilum]|nr:PH domain-containing protein [Desulfonatronum thiosulfatophilum]
MACLALYGIGIFLLLFLEFLRCYERYSINDENMVIEKGILSKKRQAFKIADIKSVHIEQNWIERLLRVGALWISIGNASGHQIVLKGIRNPVFVYDQLSKQ